MDGWLKLPGLFYRSEFEEVIQVDGEHEYLFISAGHDDQRRVLVAIYCRAHDPGHPVQLDMPRVRARPAPAAIAGGAA